MSMSDAQGQPRDREESNRKEIKGTLMRPRKLPGETKQEAARRIAKQLVKLLRRGSVDDDADS